MRLGFAGSPAFAATILQALLDAGYPVHLVLTQPDRPTGRGRKLKENPVKQLAEANGLPVWDPPTLKGATLAPHALDLLIVAAYGLILPKQVLTDPKHGCLNVHASLLPRWRGAAPVERAIMAGDAETGVCLMQMDEGLDTGPVYECASVTIGPLETGGALEARLAEAGARLLLDNLPNIESLMPRSQPEAGVTYAEKITPADSVVDWDADAASIARRVRALSERQPVTVYARPSEDEVVRVRLLGPATDRGTEDAHPGTILRIDASGLAIACGQGSVLIPEVQINRGKGRPMRPMAAANGYPNLFTPGLRLLSTPDSRAR